MKIKRITAVTLIITYIFAWQYSYVHAEKIHAYVLRDKLDCFKTEHLQGEFSDDCEKITYCTDDAAIIRMVAKDPAGIGYASLALINNPPSTPPPPPRPTVPLAECYGWNYPEIGTATEASNYLSNIFESYVYNNSTSAYYVRRTMDKDAVLCVVGRSINGGGGMFCRDSSGDETKLTAYMNYNDSSAYSIEAAFNETKLRYLRFAFFAGSQTARYNETYGSLLDICAEYGVDTVAGFKENVGEYQLNHFVKRFFLHATSPVYGSLPQTITLREARNRTITDAFYQYGQKDIFLLSGVNSFLLKGADSDPGSVRLSDLFGNP